MRLQKIIGRIDQVQDTNRPAFEFTKWQQDAENAIRLAFEEHSSGRHIERFQAIRYTPAGIYDVSDAARVHRAARNHGLEEARGVLESMVDEIQCYSGD